MTSIYGASLRSNEAQPEAPRGGFRAVGGKNVFTSTGLGARDFRNLRFRKLEKSRRPKIELLCVGSELLAGRLNTHQGYLSTALLRAGLGLERETSLPDDEGAVAAAIRQALGRSDAVLVSGGLGPTFDDVTRQAAARALGRALRYRPSLFEEIRRKFFRTRLNIPEENRRQAFVLRGARILDNRAGSAPGQLLTLPPARVGGPPRTLVLMPGPFQELEPMFRRDVLGALQRRYARGLRAESRVLHLSGVSESAADEKLAPLTARPAPGLSFTILASEGQVDFHIYARAASRARARSLAQGARRAALAAVGRHVWGEGEETLESAAGKILKGRRLSLAVAESCTGGMLGARLTAVPGSSAYFRGGVLAYDNGLKRRLLGVPSRTLARHGAVSQACAAAMAAGARASARADVGLSVTGIAGPAGATADKPVGLVFIGVAFAEGKGKTAVRRLLLPGDRDAIRRRACAAALHFLWKSLKIDTPSD